MSITLESTSDTPEQVQSALGGEKPKEAKPEVKKSEATEVSETDDAETAEDSDASENEGEDTEKESDESDEPEGEKKPKKKTGFQRRIEKLNKAKAEAERERDYYREQAMKSQKPEAEKPQAKADQSTTGAPDPQDFDTHADYIKAIVKFEREQEKAADEQSKREREVRERAQKTEQSHFERLETFKEAHPDFDDALDEVDDVRMPHFVVDAIVESEVGPEVMYELAKNRDELERICALSPLAAARAIGKIEARLGSKPSDDKPAIKKTSAPAPLKPVGTKSSIGPKSPDEMDHDEYKAWRAKNK